MALEQLGERVVLDFSASADHGDVQEDAVLACVLADADCGIGVTDAGTQITLALTRPIKANVEAAIYVPGGKRLGVVGET